MKRLNPFTVVRRGTTPEEAFEKAKADGFANNVHGKDYMVFVEAPKHKRPFKYVKELLDTNVFLRDKNGPVGCLLACPAGWVDECHVVGRKPESEIEYIAFDGQGNELYNCSDENQAIRQARQWAAEHAGKINIRKKVSVVEKNIECHALPDNHLNAYWFFGWAMV